MQFVENEFKTLDALDSSLFSGQTYFNNGAQLNLILQPFCYTLKRLGDTKKNVSRKY